MNAAIRFTAAIVAFSSAPALLWAQESAPGNVVAEQLAQSSLRMVGSMFAVLMLVAVCAWALRRWRDRQGVDSGSIELVSGISLGSKERVVLLRVGSDQVLVGVSPAGMRSLHVVSQETQAVAADAEPVDPLVVPPRVVPGEFSLSLGATQ